MLFLCLNISTSVSVKPVRPEINASAILSSFSCCLCSEFSNYLRKCLEEYVPLASSAAVAVIFPLLDMMRVKIKGKIKTKYFLLVFFCCFQVDPSLTSCIYRNQIHFTEGEK